MDLSTVFGDELHAALRAAANEGPTAVDDASGGVWVLRHADVERLAHDRRLAGIGLAMFDLLGVPDGLLREWYRGLMFTNEGDAHNRLRGLVSRAFTPRAVNALRERAARLADDAVAPIAGDGGGDLVDALALVPMRVMCSLLGVPDGDVAVFGLWADDLSPIFGFMSPEQMEAAETALGHLLAYVEELAERRRHDPGEDLITALLAAEHEGGRLRHDEVVAMVANLLVGGHDTTASQLGCTCVTLVRHPDETDRIREDPALIGPAVTETLRYEPSISGVPRTATEPIEVDGLTIEPGGIVFLSTMAANREPGVWDDPERFDVARFVDPDAPRLLTFGAGPHYCLGAALARLTVEEAVRAIVALGPLEPAEDPWSLEWRSVLGRAPARVPVTVS